MNEPHISLTGYLGGNPELRTTAGGARVVDLRVASSRRIKVGEEWQDGETMWFEVACWNELAETVAESLHKGDKVMVEGKLAQRTWVREDGTSVPNLVIDARTVGVDLSRFPVKVIKQVREGGAAETFADQRINRTTGEVPAAFEEIAA
ncbi:MAG: ssb [Frankiales bacterium]|nr:ssb [Frankiales bacterium]